MIDPSTTSRSRAWVEVRLDRIRENARSVLRAVGPETGLVPMVKADAYGLGMERVARALAEVPGPDGPWAFGVATVAEGERMRSFGWPGRILAFTPTPPGEFERAADARLTLCMSDLAGVRRWADVAARRGEPLPMHVEIDTGMGRAGFPWSEAASWGAEVAAAAGPLRWEGCFTHFHSADETELRPTDDQWARFREAVAALPEPPGGGWLIHSSNSAASLRREGFGGDLARPGIFLYGGEVGAAVVPLPVASVRARLVRVQPVSAGATVGYGATYTARAPERWGTLAIGYGDGVRRALAAGGGEVLIRGRRLPIIGRISMDMTTVNLTDLPEAEPGDVATLIGRDGDEEITVDQVAARCGTISYEILTGLTSRLLRMYLEGDPLDGGPG